MTDQTLNDSWLMRECGTPSWLPASVPGGVHLDLMNAGRIPDPFMGDEELRVQWVAERDWEYMRRFAVDVSVASAEHVELVFEGLDTLADVRLNGELLGSADNMFRTWRWEVTDRIHRGENELEVLFRSAVVEAAALDAARHLISANDQLPGAPYLRKAPYHFGWDWGTKLPNIGFWQGVKLEGWSGARLADVRLGQSIDGDRGRIEAEIVVERTRTDGAAGPGTDSAAPLEAVLRVRHPGGGVDTASCAVKGETSRVTVEIADLQLWWPNGLGGQPLYELEIELVEGARQLDTRSMQIGFRTVELHREPDEWGESFRFVVNGVPIFARGSNWIPADSFPGRIDAVRLESLLGAAAAANHNMVRVWGGGYYEVEAFYDACDRLGLLVWQDFMFACSVYPMTDEAFIDGVRAEVREQVRRLRHRACLALWCGNNEMERGWADWGWDRPDTHDLKSAYVRFFGETLPAWVAADDSATPYWPSSPSSGRPLVEAIGPAAGDEHEWRVWHGLEPFAAYARKSYRFVSEFGFESLPAEATIAAFASDPADWNLGSPLLDHHQRCKAGNARILFYLAEQFRLPSDFGGLVYLSQVLQADAMRVGVEHWRRDRDRCGGALYWQLNDSWPVSSWSSIDYYGRWKALHYATRRFFEPLLLSCAIDGDDAGIYVTSDLVADWHGRVRWSLEGIDGRVVGGGDRELTIRGLGTTRVGSVAVPRELDDRRSTVLVMELLDKGVRRSLSVAPFVPDKHLDLPRAVIERAFSIEGEGVAAAATASATANSTAAATPRRAAVRLTSNILARWVELTIEGVDVIFDDNYFDLPAGRDVTVGFDVPSGWDLDKIRAAFRLRSVADTYQ
jgi:beta-mannosidase